MTKPSIIIERLTIEKILRSEDKTSPQIMLTGDSYIFANEKAEHYEGPDKHQCMCYICGSRPLEAYENGKKIGSLTNKELQGEVNGLKWALEKALEKRF